ncbi:MAG: DUF6600 domain-containing protein [Candidatus Binatia bacterium]
MHRKHTHRTHVVAISVALALVAGGFPAVANDEPPSAEEAKEIGRTPPRLSFTDGDVSFWRPGAEDWVQARVNTAIAPGDQLYAGDRANLELQIGARAFVRAGAETQLGIENQEPDFLQLKVTAGHASIDLRSVTAGHTVELDTPNAVFTINRTGYYRVDVDQEMTTFITRRGGNATMVPAGGQAVAIAPSEEVVVQGTDTASVGTYVAPEVDDWDRWNYDRTDNLIDSVSARYVSPGMYGTDALDHYGDWRVVPPYGPVWVPGGVAAGWAPYSMGRWIWDPYYGWSWIDEAPWGWAPYHYGRWVHMTGFWGWAPGPVVVAPVYAPALVAFFGGSHWGVSIGVGVPAVSWVALGWGEPCIPWWGHAGFVGRPWWGGWGGPRIVNNVVVNRTTIVNINNITYQNVNVNNAVVAVREDRFGRGLSDHVRLREADLHNLEPVRGPLPVKPVSASLVPASEHAAGPPAAIASRQVVAAHAPHDTSAELRAQGLSASPTGRSAPAPRLVEAPHQPHAALVSPRAPFGQQGTTERPRPSLPPSFGGGPRQPAGSQAQRPIAPQAPAVSERRAPAPQLPAQRAPAGVAPSAPAPERRVPQAPAPAPRAPAPRAPAPQSAAPRAAAPRMPQAPARAPAAPRQELPGEPANRLFRSSPEARVPRAAAPAPARPSAAPRHQIAPRGAPRAPAGH